MRHRLAEFELVRLCLTMMRAHSADVAAFADCDEPIR